MSALVSEYGKRLLELQARARALRDEVARLHATRRTLALRDSTEARAAALRAVSQDAMTADGDVSVSPTPPSHTPAADRDGNVAEAATVRGGGGGDSSSRRPRARAARVRSVDAPPGVSPSSQLLPPAYAHELQEKIGAVRLAMRARAAAQRERADVLAQLTAAEQRSQDAEQAHVRLMELAGVTDMDGRSDHLAAMQRADAYKAELQATARLYTERDTIQEQLKAQTAELSRLATLLEEMTSAQEQKQDALVILREKQARLEELRRERAALERKVCTKDKMLAKTVHGVTEETRVRAATMDRRVVMHELQKEEATIRQNDLSIRHRALQIAKLEKRLEMIGDAVAGDDRDGVERVDVELADVLMREMEALYRDHDEADARTQSLDAQIERLDGKIAAFRRATASTHKEMGAVAQNHRRYMAALQRELRAELQAKKVDMATVRHEIAELRSASARATARSRSRSERANADVAEENAAAVTSAPVGGGGSSYANAATQTSAECTPVVTARKSNGSSDGVRSSEQTPRFRVESAVDTCVPRTPVHEKTESSVVIVAVDDAQTATAAAPLCA